MNMALYSWIRYTDLWMWRIHEMLATDQLEENSESARFLAKKPLYKSHKPPQVPLEASPDLRIEDSPSPSRFTFLLRK